MSALGRIPEWSLGAGRVVRAWDVLQLTPEGLERLYQDGPEIVAKDHQDLTWMPAYSTVAGDLPESEMPVLNHRYWHNEGYSAARFHLEATRAGSLSLTLPSAAGLDVFLNGAPVRSEALGALELPQGPSIVTILVRHDEASGPLRVELAGGADTGVTLRLAAGR